MFSERRKIITGNWKMHKTIAESIDFVRQLKSHLTPQSYCAWLAVPFTAIQPLSQEAQSSELVIGAQNMNDASEGAFTGEIAGHMLKEAGAQFVLLGHSERRRFFYEDDACINRKIKRALEEQLIPVLCVGETAEEHQAGQTHEVIERQLKECLAGILPASLTSLVVAYEPVWAIGTGEFAEPGIVQQVHAFCRQILKTLLGEQEGSNIPIQYGGSVNASNASQFLEQPDIDGLLVGGASLSLESFIKIVNDKRMFKNF